MTYLLALDQGTSSSRSIVFDAQGAIVATAQREFTQHYPQPGWVEHDPEDIWQTQLATALQALAQAGLTSGKGAGQITALGITNQRETTLLWDRRTGQPLHRAIVWQDRRTEPLCARLRAEGHEPLVAARTGLRLDPYFSGTKLAWLLDAIPGARARAERGELAFGTVDSWLLWKLTGGAVHATDVSNASRTLLFNLQRQCWDDDLLALLRVPAALLPAVCPSSHVYGHSRPELLGAAVPIAGVAGDQQSALFGQACFRPGLAKNTYGTGCFMLMHTGEQPRASANGLITTAACQVAGPVQPTSAETAGSGSGQGLAALARPQFALEGSVFIGGAVVQWLRDGLRAIEASSQVQALAESVPDAGGVMLVPAFTGLGAPYWNADARGAIVGLTRGSTLAHIARAALESIAFQSAALLQAMNRDLSAPRPAGTPDGPAGEAGPASERPGARPGALWATAATELRVDGGACVNDLLMQFQADLLGIPVLRPQVTETTALGAAYLAGLAAGVWRDLDELSAQWRVERTFTPTMPRERAQELMARWERAVRQAVAE